MSKKLGLAGYTSEKEVYEKATAGHKKDGHDDRLFDNRIFCQAGGEILPLRLPPGN